MLCWIWIRDDCAQLPHYVPSAIGPILGTICPTCHIHTLYCLFSEVASKLSSSGIPSRESLVFTATFVVPVQWWLSFSELTKLFTGMHSPLIMHDNYNQHSILIQTNGVIYQRCAYKSYVLTRRWRWGIRLWSRISSGIASTGGWNGWSREGWWHISTSRSDITCWIWLWYSRVRSAGIASTRTGSPCNHCCIVHSSRNRDHMTL